MKRTKKGQKPQRIPATLVVRGSLPKLVVAGTSLSAKTSTSPMMVTLDLPTSALVYTVVAGVLAASGLIDKSIIPAFATRFGATFVEYRILGFRGTIRQRSNTGSTQDGTTAFFLDERNAAVPTSSTSLDHPRIEIANIVNSSDKLHMINWVANDITDEQWTNTAATITPVYLKGYTDASNFGTSTTTVVTYAVMGTIRFQFRGLL